MLFKIEIIKHHLSNRPSSSHTLTISLSNTATMFRFASITLILEKEEKLSTNQKGVYQKMILSFQR